MELVLTIARENPQVVPFFKVCDADWANIRPNVIQGRLHFRGMSGTEGGGNRCPGELSAAGWSRRRLRRSVDVSGHRML